ncbi:MAG: DUF429 domain-containing protein [Candidatus Binatia bacterium]
MHVVGVDLSGPANTKDTSIAVFEAADSSLILVEAECDGSDASVLKLVAELSKRDSVVVGLDAPLSYQPGGGLRTRDAELRVRIVACGMRHGSIMPPTLNRMVYLTLRGMTLARALSNLPSERQVRVVEVHPGAALCLRGAPIDAVRKFAKDEDARLELLEWLGTEGIEVTKAPSPCPSSPW